MRLDLDIDRPGLVFHFGSILATLAKGSLSVAGWSLALFSGRGVGGSKRADRIMEDFRTLALKKPGVEPLARLDELSPRNLEGKSAVIVLMHGLFSTDVGLFDPLLRFLRADNGFDNCTILGWPHNTLMSIDGNAVELLELFSTVVGLHGPHVAFICHSRGGLVARAAAVELCEANSKWRDKLKACVTFGTPHRGSQLAETPDQLIGSLLALQAYHGGEGFFSLADALHFAHQQPIAGVRDMRPLGGDGAFLRDLVRREVKIAATSARSMPILAIGGEAKEKTFFATLARRALGGTANDLVVETTSSANRTATETLVTECNHFEYFRVANSPRNGFEETASFLRARLGLPEHKIGIYKKLQITTAESPVSVPEPTPKKDHQ
jgi:pimeloyl-ACP methyl ester carboxylesterase